MQCECKLKHNGMLVDLDEIMNREKQCELEEGHIGPHELKGEDVIGNFTSRDESTFTQDDWIRYAKILKAQRDQAVRKYYNFVHWLDSHGIMELRDDFIEESWVKECINEWKDWAEGLLNE